MLQLQVASGGIRVQLSVPVVTSSSHDSNNRFRLKLAIRLDSRRFSLLEHLQLHGGMDGGMDGEMAGWMEAFNSYYYTPSLFPDCLVQRLVEALKYYADYTARKNTKLCVCVKQRFSLGKYLFTG